MEQMDINALIVGGALMAVVVIIYVVMLRIGKFEDDYDASEDNKSKMI